MNTENMIRQLRYEAEKHKHDKLFTGQTNISIMCADVADRLEELYKEVEETRSELYEYRALNLTPQRLRIIDREYSSLVKKVNELTKSVKRKEKSND